MLIESLIELSNINSSEHKQNINLNDEIKGIIKDFKSKSEKKEISIIYTKKSDKILNINRQYFYILFSNILSNAIRYNKK
jgi:signal transduction histidine kinase